MLWGSKERRRRPWPAHLQVHFRIASDTIQFLNMKNSLALALTVLLLMMLVLFSSHSLKMKFTGEYVMVHYVCQKSF